MKNINFSGIPIPNTIFATRLNARSAYIIMAYYQVTSLSIKFLNKSCIMQNVSQRRYSYKLVFWSKVRILIIQNLQDSYAYILYRKGFITDNWELVVSCLPRALLNLTYLAYFIDLNCVFSISRGQMHFSKHQRKFSEGISCFVGEVDVTDMWIICVWFENCYVLVLYAFAFFVVL